MVNKELYEKIEEILCEKDEGLIFEQIKSLNNKSTPYDDSMIFVLLYLSNKLRTVDEKHNPFGMLERNFTDNDIIFKLQEMIEKTACLSLKAKFYDCLWVFKKDYLSAKKAVRLYIDIIKSTMDFRVQSTYMYRIINISLSLRDKDLTKCAVVTMKEILKNSETVNFLLLNLLSCCYNNKLFSEADVIELCNEFEERISSINLSEAYLELKEKCLVKSRRKKEDVQLIEIRRKRVDMLIKLAEDDDSEFRRIDIYKKAIKILKNIPDTTEERKKVRRLIEKDQESISEKMVRHDIVFDFSKVSKFIKRAIDVLDEDEYMCFLLDSIEIEQKETVRKRVIKNQNEFISQLLFGSRIIDEQGRQKANLPPLNIEDEATLLNYMERESIQYYSIQNTFNIELLSEMKKTGHIFERDIEELVERSYFIPENRKNSFKIGIEAGFNNDFITALNILVPQVENSIRFLATEFLGEIVYSMDDKGNESVRMLHDILISDSLNEYLDEDIVYNLKLFFTSIYGFNMRNEIAHGMINDDGFGSTAAKCTWFFILKLCFIFSKIDFLKMKKICEKVNKCLEN